jgi:hypothetical protein
MVGSQKPAAAASAEEAGAVAFKSILDTKLTRAQKHSHANTSKILDASLRSQLSKRTVNVLTLGPSEPPRESLTIRAVKALFSKVQIRSVSDYNNMDELVGEWRKTPDTPPAELVPGAAVFELTTWYVPRTHVLSSDDYSWGDGTLPQETIGKLKPVIFSPELKVGG